SGDLHLAGRYRFALRRLLASGDRRHHPAARARVPAGLGWIPAPMATLSVSHLSKAYGGVLALRDLSFDVAGGELVALIGPNGAGKTTCFNVLNGQLAADSGEVRLDGTSLAGLAPHEVARLGVGRTFQIAALFGSMSVRENVQVALLS